MIGQQERHDHAGLADSVPELTALEQQILELTWRGYSLSMIGAALHLSTRTVEAYRYGMLKKFNVRNAMQLVRAALRQGMLEI